MIVGKIPEVPYILRKRAKKTASRYHIWMRTYTIIKFIILREMLLIYCLYFFFKLRLINLVFQYQVFWFLNSISSFSLCKDTQNYSTTKHFLKKKLRKIIFVLIYVKFNKFRWKYVLFTKNRKLDIVNGCEMTIIICGWRVKKTSLFCHVSILH